jgi:hypothetical protein
MTTRLQQFYIAKQMSEVDCRNINILTILSKLIMVMVLGVVVMVISLLS